MTTTELVRTLRARGLQGDVEGFVETADEDEIRELLHDLGVEEGGSSDDARSDR